MFQRMKCSLVSFVCVSGVGTTSVTPHENKEQRCDVNSLLMKTLNWSVKRLGRECNVTGLCLDRS